MEQLARMLDALLPQAESSTFLGPDVTEAVFITSLIWSCGAGLVEEGRVVYDQLVKRLSSMPQNPAEGSTVGPGMVYTVLPCIADSIRHMFAPLAGHMTLYIC